jgi:hypothetical protein
MPEEVWTEYEYNAVLKALQKALDDGLVPPEERAALFRGKQRTEKVTVRRAMPRQPKYKQPAKLRWE